MYKQHAMSRIHWTLLQVLLLVALSSVTVAVSAAEPASPITLEGTVVIQVADDFEHARSTILYFLRERRSNELVELKLSPQQAQQLRTGQELRVRGSRSGKAVAADPAADAITVLTAAAPLAALTPPATARRVISIIVDITDGSGNLHTVNDTCDGAEELLADEMFGSRTGRLNVDGCFRDSSYDALGFGGTSYPGTAMDVIRVAITDPAPSLAGVCTENWFSWGREADSAAIAQGLDLSAYAHRMYILPEMTGCPYAGVGSLSCTHGLCTAWAWARSGHPCGLRDILAHELGHNLGLQHASTDETPNCGYCDTSDFMGYGIGTLRGINAPHRGYLGWLGPARMVDGASGGEFTISALAMPNPPYPQAVKIVPPSGGAYWLSYRAPIGYDTQLESRYFNKLHVHHSQFGSDSVLIDQLADGATHFNEDLNLTVRQVSHTADSATLHVQYGAAFSLSTDSLVFGSQLLNTASSAQTITLLSNGGTDLPITSIAIGGIDSHQFAQRNDCGVRLAPGASCTIEVTFKPTTTGSKVATLSVTAPGGSVTRTVSLSGPAVASAFTLSATSLVFGSQPLNLASSAKTVTLRSTGVAALPIASIAIEGLNFSQFAQTNNCGTSVPVGASCAIRVTFKPTNPGSKTAILNVTAEGAVGTQVASLSGTAVRSIYTLSTSSLVFGSQALNLASSPKTIALRNTGSMILPITKIAIGGINPYQFAQTHNCGTSVLPGASCAIKVTFKPTITGSKVASLIVTAGGGAGTKSVALSGTAVRSTFSVSPTALSFGRVARSSTSPAKTVRISNTGGVALPISAIDLAGTNAGQFARTHKCPAQLAVGGSCTVSVVFKPTSAGAKSAILRVTPGGGAALKTAALSGTGI